MESIYIEGGTRLVGEVGIQGSKNAALPILAATMLIRGKTVLHRIPRITDITHMINLLQSVGCVTEYEDGTLIVDATDINRISFPRKDVDCMRSSILLLAPMLHRMEEVLLHYPGGCVIGERPVDMHIRAMKELGAVFIEEEVLIHAKAEKLLACDISLPIASVGVTENIVMAAVLAEGTTRIHYAAREPEISELCLFLQSAGARIKGIGNGELVIEGVENLHETEYTIVSDRIVAGTYLFSAIGCGGEVTLLDAPVSHMEKVIETGRALGAEIEAYEAGQTVTVRADGNIKSIPFLETGVYPGFPTDLQSCLIALLAKADGISVVAERIFENRFRIVEELMRMGAKIIQDDGQVIIWGVGGLFGTELKARELRGGAALICAGLMAQGDSALTGVSYIRRGYEDIVGDLSALGASIRMEEI